MTRPTTPDFLCWMFSIVVHGELVMILGLVLGGEELDHQLPEEPVFRSAMVEQARLIRYEPIPDTFGRWPMECDHRALIKAFRTSGEPFGSDVRCEVCNWPWWVIRASLSD